MVIKKYHLLLIFTCFFTISISMVFMTQMAVAADDASVETEDSIVSDVAIEEPSISGVSGGLQVGDIIAQAGGKKSLIPGYYDHVQIYIGNGRVVEAEPGDGVHYDNYRSGDVYRVSTSSAKKAGAVNFAKAQVGKNYDYWLLAKQVYGSKYYCSELAWAGYLVAGGPDIDQNPGWSWTYARAVAPQEVADDGNTYYVGSV